MRRDGATALFLAIDGRAAAVIAIADPIKPTTSDALRQLKALGLRIVMLTGDNRTTAEAVASHLHIAEVAAEVLPADKHDLVRRLKRDGHVVAMAGDGVNDAPALAAADIGIAMGTGTEVAIASAGITLVKGDLTGIVTGDHAQPRHHAQHPTEPVLCLYLQCDRCSDCRWRAVSGRRHSAQPGHCRTCHVVQFRLRDRQRAAPAPPPAVNIETLLQLPAR